MSITKQSVSKSIASQTRYFVSGVNSFVGQELVELLRNDNENDINPNIIVGTLNKQDPSEIPRGVRKIIDTNNLHVLASVFLDQDVIIFDIQQSEVDEIEFALKLLKYGELEQPKTFILISTPLTWAGTLPKDKKNDQETSRTSLDENGECSDPEWKSFNQKYSKILETDLGLRKCPKRYDSIKELELKVISSSKTHLRTFVICPGIIYGNGEDVLFNQFKRAWMHPEDELCVIGDGRNVLPMIHVKDLAQLVKKTLDLTPSSNYIFAVDHTVGNTQRKIIQSIADKVGGGTIKHISYQEAAFDLNFDLLTLNLWMKPTTVFDNDADLIDAQKNPVIPWHSKEGFCKNILKVREQFQIYRGLSTVKVVLMGPAYSGKSKIGAQLATKYQIPHITIFQLVEQISQLQIEIGQRVKKTLQEVRDQLIQEGQTQFDADKKKQKKVPKGQIEPEFDSSKIVPRLPEALLIEVYKWRLEQNDAQNLGYVIDGFPKTGDQAQGLFMKKIMQEDETETTELNSSFIPKAVIILSNTDDQIKERVKQTIPSEELASTKYNDDILNKRLLKYKSNYEGLIDFYQQTKIEYKLFQNPQQDEILQQCIEFIERDGPIMVLQGNEEPQKQVDSGQSEKLETLKSQNTIRAEDFQQEQHERQSVFGSVVNIKETKSVNITKGSIKQDKSDAPSVTKMIKKAPVDEQKKVVMDEETRIEQIKAQEREILDTRSQPLRQYLADNVVPYLTEGLILICKEMPDNPVLFLADFLEAKGIEIQMPFPGQH